MTDMQTNSNQNKSTRLQLLALSGGGIRGLFSIKILAELEQDLADEAGEQDYNIARHFDLICGTSVGGLLALGLAYGLNARELLEFIEKNRRVIFPQFYSLNKTVFTRPIYQILRGIKKALITVYTQNRLRQALEQVFGQATIGDLNKRVVIPAVNYSTGAMKAFKTPHHYQFRRDWRLKLVDVALATSAAPTYFPVHEVDAMWYVDGGLVANAPGLVGVHEVIHFIEPGINPEHIRLLAVGTMGTKDTANQEKSRRQGYLRGWGMGRRILELTFSANETLHNQIVEHLLGEEHCLFLDQEQTPEQSRVLSLDNASDGAAKILTARGADVAQNITDNKLFREIVRHDAGQPALYAGPNKNSNHP